MLDKVIQIEIVSMVGIIALISLYFNQIDLAETVVAGLLGFLGGQTLDKNISKKNPDA